MVKQRGLRLCACLCLAALVLCGCVADGTPGSAPPDGASSLRLDASESASGTSVAPAQPAYELPQPAAIVEPPPYSRPAALPGPALIPLESTLEDAGPEGEPGSGVFKRKISYYPFDSTEPIGIPSPIVESDGNWAGAFVAGRDFAAAVWGSDTVNFGLSRDNGESWTNVEVDAAPFPASSKSVCFADESLGWLTVTRSNTGQAMLYKTIDGGKTWQQTGYFTGAYWLNCYFATEKVGWLIGVDTGGDIPTLMETADGGESWYPVRLASPEAGEAAYLPGVLPAYSLLNGWLLTHSPDWEAPPLLYSAAGEGAMWEQKPLEQFFELPDGIGYMDLNAGLNFVIPMTYSSAAGLSPGQIGSFWLGCNTRHYIEENYGAEAVVDDLLTEAQLNEYIRYQYDDAGFDSTQVEGYDAAAGGIRHGCGHGGLGKNMYLRQSKLQANGDIELYFDMVPMALGSEYYYCTGTYYIVVRPQQMPGGGRIFTLLESKPLTPLPKSQSMHFSV